MLSEASTNDSAAQLGARVRTLRRERGMTLKALGRLAGLSHPFLSQLERGLARPSVGSVERIAHAFGVPVGELWSPARRPGDVRLVRRAEGEVVRHGVAGAPGGVREVLGEDEPLQTREWSGGSRRWPAETSTRPGVMVIYVLRGELEAEVAGTVHVLEEGDALRFDGKLAHRLRRTGSPGTRALLLTL